MATVRKSLIIPDLEEYPVTKIDPATGLAENNMPTASDILSLLDAGKYKDNSSKSIKTVTPFARQDMLARRNKIGEYNQALEDAMKIKEGVGYSIANALAGIPQQQGYGTWLSDFARAFGGGMKSASDAAINRQKTMAYLALKDIDTALKLDKEMGGTTVENSYSPPDYSTQLAMSLLTRR